MAGPSIQPQGASAPIQQAAAESKNCDKLKTALKVTAVVVAVLAALTLVMGALQLSGAVQFTANNFGMMPQNVAFWMTVAGGAALGVTGILSTIAAIQAYRAGREAPVVNEQQLQQT